MCVFQFEKNSTKNRTIGDLLPKRRFVKIGQLQVQSHRRIGESEKSEESYNQRHVTIRAFC